MPRKSVTETERSSVLLATVLRRRLAFKQIRDTIIILLYRLLKVMVGFNRIAKNPFPYFEQCTGHCNRDTRVMRLGSKFKAIKKGVLSKL